jgi:hypothetical protein
LQLFRQQETASAAGSDGKPAPDSRAVNVDLKAEVKAKPAIPAPKAKPLNKRSPKDDPFKKFIKPEPQSKKAGAAKPK